MFGVYRNSSLQFPTFILGLLTLDFLIYLTYYVRQKYKHGERVLWHSWAWLLAAMALLITAIFFFAHSPTNKFLTPAESRKLNRECIVFGYFDDHDVWHFLSAAGTAAMFMAVFTLDDDVSNVPRSKIAVF